MRPTSSALLLGIVLLTTAAIEAADKVKVEKVEYGGWPNNLKISNGEAELIVTLDVGPRIISYRLANGKNVFKNYDDQLGGMGEKDWKIRGGHRLWVAPEDPKRTYFADNLPVGHEVLGDGTVRFQPGPEVGFGLQKVMDVRLAPSGSEVTVTHVIHNFGGGPTEMAAWSLSVMAPGGVEIIPLPPKGKHPGSAENAKSAADFAPNQVLALWPFTDLKDPRWDLGSRFITLTQDPKAAGPTKLGLSVRTGAVGYLNGGTMFVKKFERIGGAAYPDGGVNYETFTNADMLEMESLGPLVKVGRGGDVKHVERWEIVPAKDRKAAEEHLTKAR